MNRGTTKGEAMASGLIVHFHGGGFLAQSSQSHEVYVDDNRWREPKVETEQDKFFFCTRPSSHCSSVGFLLHTRFQSHIAGLPEALDKGASHSNPFSRLLLVPRGSLSPVSKRKTKLDPNCCLLLIVFLVLPPPLYFTFLFLARALLECFYAYRWALANADKLGSFAERVVVTGDSAGGNLCVAVSLLCAAHGIRPPDATLAALVNKQNSIHHQMSSSSLLTTIFSHP